MRKYFLLLIPVLFLPFLLFTHKTYFSCDPKGFKVIDGDTFYFKGMKIRILGIDTPELSKIKEWHKKYIKNEKCYKRIAYRAKEELEKILKNYCIKIKIVGKDKYGRFLAKVYNCTENICTDIGKYFVLSGLAFSFKDYYKKEEEIARKNKKGIWRC